MALDVRTLRDAARPAAILADRRLWLAADRATIVEDGDVRAAFLLVGQGGEIPAPEVERLGLAVDAGRVVLPQSDKARPVSENKMRRKGEDK